ncbi:hypothetical protein [Duganella qianjiadongensis]|uniref:Uncharacterized protein n=1 Tax=Duganella qianjiadongensis TaxID=2692176 RepID=A0ABW9VN35_9BURK|nr:hypothetical protein [Duganella qianjiadongensis]MYM40848.1 hypothetical protein [Duganella qianjiadongensis]
MTISIRKLSHTHDACATYATNMKFVLTNLSTLGIARAKPAAPQFAPRTLAKSYIPPTGLWGRITVALSGAAARRERACARLNTFYDGAQNSLVATEFSNVAMLKFIKAYDECDDRVQRSAMMQSLNADVRVAAETALNWGRR